MTPERVTAESQLERLLYVLPAAAREGGCSFDELAEALGVPPAMLLPAFASRPAMVTPRVDRYSESVGAGESERSSGGVRAALESQRTSLHLARSQPRVATPPERLSLS